MKKRVVFQVIPKLKSGGVERTVLDLVQCDFWSREGVDQYIVSSGGNLLESYLSQGGNHVTLSVHSKNPFVIFWTAWKLAQKAKKMSVDIFHVHSRAPAWCVLIASKITKVPYVASYNGAYRSHSFLRKWYNSAMVRGDFVIAISDFIAQVIQRDQGHRHPKIITIPLGINVDLFNSERYQREEIEAYKRQLGIPLNSKILLTIGRPSLKKGHDVAIQVLAQLEDPSSHLLIVTPDDDSNKTVLKLKAMIHDLGVCHRVHFIHGLEDIPFAYELSDVVLFPTQLKETFGRISAEAGAMEKIVIASNLGAIPEVIEDSDTGYVLPPDDLKVWVETANHVLSLKASQYSKIGKNARERVVTSFSLQNMCQKLLELYNGVAPKNLQ